MSDELELSSRFGHGLTSVSTTNMVATSVTPNAVSTTILSVVSLVVALTLREPAAIAFVLPYLLSLLGGLERFRKGTIEVLLDCEHGRAVQGDELTYIASVSSTEGVDRCTVEFDPGRHMRMISAPKVTVRVEANSTVEVPFVVELTRWGLVRPEKLHVQTSDVMSLLSRNYEFNVDEDIRVALPSLSLRETIEPGRYRDIAGGHRSESRGEGIELADIREYRSGDPIRSINWRISNRRREPWVTLRHPDRSATIVIVADTYGAHLSMTVEPGVVRAVEALAGTHLALHDKVGALLLGPDIEWIPPQLGERQKYRITDAFIDTTQWSRDWSTKPDLHRLISSDAVVIIVSTLRDRRILSHVAALRAGGRHIAILEPVIVVEAEQLSKASHSPEVDRASRLDRLDRDANRRALRRDGLLVVPWEIGTPLDPAMRTLRIVYGAVQASAMASSRTGAMR